MHQRDGDQRYEDELYPASMGRSAGRPILTAVSLVAIAALGLGGLYQGIRFTFPDLGPAPNYSQTASAESAAAPMATPELQAVSDEAHAPARPRLMLAANDDAPPSPKDGSQTSTVAAIVPVDGAALIPTAGSSQGVTLDQPAAAVAAAPDQPHP